MTRTSTKSIKITALSPMLREQPVILSPTIWTRIIRVAQEANFNFPDSPTLDPESSRAFAQALLDSPFTLSDEDEVAMLYAVVRLGRQGRGLRMTPA